MPPHCVCAHRWTFRHPAAQGMYVKRRSLVTAPSKKSDQTLTQRRGQSALPVCLVPAASQEQLSVSRGLEFSRARGQLSLSFKRERSERADPSRDSLRWASADTLNACTDVRRRLAGAPREAPAGKHLDTGDEYTRYILRTTRKDYKYWKNPRALTISTHKTETSAQTAASHGSWLDERPKSCPPPKRKRTGASRECPYRRSQRRLTLEIRTRAHPLPPYSKSVLALRPFRLRRYGASARLRIALASSSSPQPAAQAVRRNYLGPQSHHLTPSPQHGVG